MYDVDCYKLVPMQEKQLQLLWEQQKPSNLHEQGFEVLNKTGKVRIT